MAVVAQQGLWLSRAGTFAQDPLTVQIARAGGSSSSISSGSSNYTGLVQAMASGEMRFASGSNLQLYSAASNVLLGAGGLSNVVVVHSNLVLLNADALVQGDLRLRGCLRSTPAPEVNVQNTVVRLGFAASNEAAPAGSPEPALHGAGILLESDADASNVYEKSLRWRAGQRVGQGAAGLVSAGGASNGPCWEFRGGGLRLTAPVRAPGRAGVAHSNTVGEVSYGLHINEREELVLYKRWTVPGSNASAEFLQNVFTFGSTGAPFTQPTSPNPFRA